EHFGASPIEYAQSYRLLQAKRLLMDSQLPLEEVAFSAGFGSLRRFNELFSARYRMTPSSLRANKAKQEEGLMLSVSYRPPYDWGGMLGFLQTRCVAGVDKVTADG
ncbi:MAG: helix-turn-helix domain-containing protein, partial [Hafnia sp.]